MAITALVWRRLRGWLGLAGWLLAIGAAAEPAPLRLLTFHEPPWVDASVQPARGVTLEVIERLFAEAGIAYSLETLPLKRALQTAMSRPNTCVFPVERSQEREASLRWVGPVVVSRYAFYPAADRRISLQTLEDARRYRIGSYLGSGLGEYLEQRGFKVTLATKPGQGPSMLARNRFDLWVSDTYSARATAAAAGVPIGEPALVFLTTLRAMGCHPDTPDSSLELLQNTLLRLLRSGALKGMVYAEPD